MWGSLWKLQFDEIHLALQRPISVKNLGSKLHKLVKRRYTVPMVTRMGQERCVVIRVSVCGDWNISPRCVNVVIEWVRCHLVATN